MSVLSDDTDVLLLIPPDFFLVPSDSEEESISLKKPSERLLVSDLISQVNDLEGRICMIENQGIVNTCNMPVQGNLQHLRHFGSADTINTSYKSNYNSRSLQTTPLKTCTLPSPCKGWRAGLHRSPSRTNKRLEHHQNMLLSQDYMNQREKDDQLLKEIDNFFSHKNNKISKDSDLNEKNSEDDKSVTGLAESENMQFSTAVFNLNKVNDLLKQLEETQAEIEQKLKLKGLNGANSEGNLIADLSDKKLQNLNNPLSDILSNESMTENRTPRRYLNFDSLSPKKNEQVICDEKNENIKSDNPTVDKNVEVGSNTTNSKTEGETIDGNAEQKVESPSSNELNNLLSLYNLWGSSKRIDDIKFCEDQKVLKQKYQEEKCRRQHCEELIQKLQLRLLEEQQKIAVAIKVDQEKDEAIYKLTEGWNKLVGHWRELESQRNNLGKKLQSEREKFQNEISVACQTVKRYETELSKALDLAHGYKEKCEMSEKEKKNLTLSATKEIDTLKTQLRDAKDRLQKEQNQTEKLEKLTTAKEESISQAKSKICEMQNQFRDLKKNLKDQQTELEILKHEKEKLSEKLKEEKSRVSVLEQGKKTLFQNNEELKKKEKSLKESLKSATEQMEKIKLELKEFYQEQVEKIVQEKLKEFQEQLTTAEKTLQKEIEERERAVAEMAVKQVQQIVEKHVVEVNLLEAKHNEEIELWKIKVVQAEEKVRELQKKVEHYLSQKTEIAQKLQNVMETQWHEALKIISASSPQCRRSPVNSARSDSGKEVTRQNTFTMSSCGWGDGNLNKNCFPLETESPPVSSVTESPFCKDGQLTFREQPKAEPQANYRIDETPQKMESELSDPLKKYIQMLLERPPGLPVDDSVDKSMDSTAFNSIADGYNLLQWQQVLSERSSQGNSEPVQQKDFLKPSKEKVPWK